MDVYDEYQRVIKYAEESAKLELNDNYCSELLSVTEDSFDESKFVKLFPRFQDFLNECYKQKLDLMISGSSVFSTNLATYDISRCGWCPIDVDIYMHATSDQQETLKKFDLIIRKTYDDCDIKLIRTPYILSWYAIIHDKVLVSYQLILTPCLRWEHVFAGYHTDMLCAGYLVKHRKFVKSARYAYWEKSLANLTESQYEDHRYECYDHFRSFDVIYDHGICHIIPKELETVELYSEDLVPSQGMSLFFPDLVSPRYRDRVFNACEKYLGRGYACFYVKPYDELYIPDIERSGFHHQVTGLLEDKHSVDMAIHINNTDDIESYGISLFDVYQGETFATVIETMSCFRKCPGGCGVFVITKKDTPNGCFCEVCHKKELEKLQVLQILLQKNPLTALVTGARCGLGKSIKTLMETNNWNVFGTTRFPNLTDDNKMLKLDLKDPDTWITCKKRLENGEINVLILSASETLHYPNEEKIGSDDKNKLNFDWTGDFVRNNSGVWHKTLDQHSYEEITSPLLANVAGSASLLASFISGVRKKRSEGSKKVFCCVVVTSFEGRFEEKTPYHPITNACKSALEQIVWTMQKQARFLDCHILLSDPGWVYTESSFGKTKGPVPIEYGVSQILQPLVAVFSEKIRIIKSQNDLIFRREFQMDPASYTFDKVYVLLQLKPCLCLVEFHKESEKIMRSCPKCKKDIVTREMFDFSIQKDLVKYFRDLGIDKYLINMIFEQCKYPTIC